jgi:sulfide:quinone oxidoreductase
MDLFEQNFLQHIQGLPMTESFDGHANCFIESGHGKGLLIDFNYDTEPLPGKYPLPGVGPFSLLKETEINHWGKVMFRWMYWNILLPGKELPLPALMSMAGKETGERVMTAVPTLTTEERLDALSVQMDFIVAELQAQRETRERSGRS